MKKRFLVFMGVLFFIFGTSVFAENVISFDKNLDYNRVVSLDGFNGGYVIAQSNGVVEKYDNNNELVAQKKFSGIKVDGILCFNDKIILYGKKNNLVNIYMLDNNLRVIHNSALNVTVNDSKINSYVYDNKAYFVLSLDGIISSDKIVSLDSSLNIALENLSDVNNLKNIVKGDYEIYNAKVSSNTSYLASAILNGNTFVVGYEKDGNDVKGFVKNLDTGKEIFDEDYKNVDALGVNGNLVVLSTNGSDSKLTIIDRDSNIVDTITVNGNGSKLVKFNNKLAVILSDKVALYNYDLSISTVDSLFGSLQVIGEANAYSEVLVKAAANSGYEVTGIEVTTSNGEIIKVTDGKFIMPSDSVTVNAVYKENVENPDTVDPIFLLGIGSLIAVIVFWNLYKKYKWLS